MNEIPKDKPVYLICYTGQKSDEIAERLSELGYEIFSVVKGRMSPYWSPLTARVS